MLLTRPSQDAEDVAMRLRAMGHTSIVAPVITIVPLPVHLPHAPVEALIVTSRHAVTSLPAADRLALASRPVFAVGAASAGAVRRGGWRDVRVAMGDGQALRDLVRLTQPRPAHLLYLAGRIHRPDLPDGLRADGYTVTVSESYDAVETSWRSDTVNDLRGVPPDATLHFSRRSAALALEAARRHGLMGWFTTMSHVCLAPDVAEPLRHAGITTVVTALQPHTDSLLAALGECGTKSH